MKNVKIPLELLSQTIDLLENIDIYGHDLSVQNDFYNVYNAFMKKRQSLELRESYSKIVFAEDEDAQSEARIRYLQHKRDVERF